MEKEGVVHIYKGILLNHKKNEMKSFAAIWIQLEVIILSKVKSERERQRSYDITHLWTLKYDTNELIYETEIDSRTYRIDLLPRRKGMGEECIGSLGLADAT